MVTLAALLWVSLVLAASPASAESYSLFVSFTADRANPVPLAEKSVNGNIYVFAAPASGVARVRFFLDDSGMTGSPRQIENQSPYDFAGTATSGAAKPFSTANVNDGSHTITAAIDLTAGGTAIVNATFSIANTPPALLFSPRTLSFAVGPATGGSASVNLNAATGTASYTISDNVAWLTVSPASGATPTSVTISADAADLAFGTYTATVTAEAPGYASDRLVVAMTVSQPRPPDQVHLAWVEDPSTTLTVVWRTIDPATPSRVEYRRSGATAWQSAAGGRRPSGTSGTLHEVTLRSLTPSAAYEYRVPGEGGAWSPIFTTRTAPRPGPADFDAIYVADIGLIGRADGLATGTEQVIEAIAEMKPLLILPGGDYAYYNTDRRYGSLEKTIDAWFNQMQLVAARSPMMPTYGNHEVLVGEGYVPWAARFPTPPGFDSRRYYSFDVGDVHFVSIFAVNDTKGLPSAAVAWTEQDIAAAIARGQRWIIPYFHVSPFADGTNHSSNLALRAQLGPMFERLGVKLVLSSHDQAYERTYPLVAVPATNTRTSTSKRCYTLDDGVTWAKISPGGKLSNISGSFSPFASEPAPAWTAFRDNSMHHFSRLAVSASGSIRLDTYGVEGDGTPPIILDSFQYTAGSCPPELAFSMDTVSTVVPEGSSTTIPTTLDVSGGSVAYIIAEDATWLTVSPTSGTTPATLTLSLDGAGLLPGTYQTTVTASAPDLLSSQLPVILTVHETTTFTLMVSASADRSNPVSLEGTRLGGLIYVFATSTAEVAGVRFFLDDPGMAGRPRWTERTGPYDFAGGTVQTANPFDTRLVTDGAHTITVAIDLREGGTAVVNATFTVANLAISLGP